MTVLFPIFAFAAAFLATHRSLGWGLVAVVGIGYFNGVIRANYLGVYTTFMFDAGVLGLYLAFFLGGGAKAFAVWREAPGKFVFILIAWATLLSLLPINHIGVQFVALRATIWFLPVLLLATRLTAADLTTLARGLVVLNLVALAFGLYVYFNGIYSLYPRNAVTEIIYRSAWLGEQWHYRVPSSFLSAHAYGGTMLLTLPLLLNQTFSRRVHSPDRLFALTGTVAAIAGMLMCAARLPIVIFALAALVLWMCSRFSPAIAVGVAGLLLAGLLIASRSERLRQVATLENTEFVSSRIRVSANQQFFELLTKYPLGAGMGSAAGTSIPYFLADQAPRQIGLENEYSRILVDQGLVGLFGWLVFLVWLLRRPPRLRGRMPWQLGTLAMYSLMVVTWCTAFIGAGLLSSVPGSVLMLTQMGVLAAVRQRGVVPGAVRARQLVSAQ